MTIFTYTDILSSPYELIAPYPVPDPYAENGFNPPLVLDFVNEVYRVKGFNKTFEEVLTYSGSSMRMLTDSYGQLKYAPHSFTNNSTMLTSWATASGGLLEQNQLAPDGTMTATRLYAAGTDTFFETFNSPFSTPVSVTSSITFDMVNKQFIGPVGLPLVTEFVEEDDVITAGSGWFRVRVYIDEVDEQTAIYVKDNGSGQITIAHTDEASAKRRFYVLGSVASTDGVTLWRPQFTIGNGFLKYIETPARGNVYEVTYGSRQHNHIWNGAAWQDKGLFIESEQRTNLVSHSNDHTQIASGWSNNAITIVPAQPNSLTGENDAQLIHPTTTGSYRWSANQNGGLPSGIHTRSKWFKPAGKNWVYHGGTNGGGQLVFFDLVNAVAGTVDALWEAGVEKGPDGWVRVWCHEKVAAPNDRKCTWAVADGDGNITATTNGTDGVLVWNGNVELGSTMSSDIITASATVTRAAETVVVPKEHFGVPNTGTSVAQEMTITYADNDTGEEGRYYALGGVYPTDGSMNLNLKTNDTLTGRLQLRCYSAPVAREIITSNTYLSPGVNIPLLSASRWGATEINMANDGNLLAPGATGGGAAPDVSNSDTLLFSNGMGNISLFRYWNEDIEDQGIIDATADPYAANGISPQTVTDHLNDYYRVNGFDSDFDTAVTYTGASIKTMYDSSGTLVEVAANEPRRGAHYWKDGVPTKGGLQLESEQRSNIIPDSTNLTNGWVPNNTDMAFNGTYSTMSASADGSNYRRIYLTNLQAVADGTCWGIFRARMTSDCWINFRIGGTLDPRLSFDIKNGVVGAGSGGHTGAGMTYMGDGWWMCWMSLAALARDMYIYMSDADHASTGANGSPTYVAVQGEGIDIMHTQFEAALTPSSVILTDGATVTRAAETEAVASGNLADYTDELSLSWDGTVTYADIGSSATAYWVYWHAASTNFIWNRLRTDSTNVGKPEFYQRDAASGNQSQVGSDAYSPGVNVPMKLAHRTISGAFKGAYEGNLTPLKSHAGTVPALNSTDLKFSQAFMGFHGSFSYWNEDIEDTGLIEATT